LHFGIRSRAIKPGDTQLFPSRHHCYAGISKSTVCRRAARQHPQSSPSDPQMKGVSAPLATCPNWAISRCNSTRPSSDRGAQGGCIRPSVDRLDGCSVVASARTVRYSRANHPLDPHSTPGRASEGSLIRASRSILCSQQSRWHATDSTDCRQHGSGAFQRRFIQPTLF
jgi:hypothetical protein